MTEGRGRGRTFFARGSPVFVCFRVPKWGGERKRKKEKKRPGLLVSGQDFLSL